MEVANGELYVHMTHLDSHAVVFSKIVEVERVDWDGNSEVVILSVHCGVLLGYKVRYFDLVNS